MVAGPNCHNRLIALWCPMKFEEATREAARAAANAVTKALEHLRIGHAVDEDDLTGILVGRIGGALDGEIGGLQWKCSILRHRRGRAAEEKKYGADLLMHVTMNTPTQSYAKGMLVQAKKVGPDRAMTVAEKRQLTDQCKRMLAVTPAAFVFDYGNGNVRCGPASRIVGAASHDLYKICGWTAYRFFLEYFRSPIGDPRITSAFVKDLPPPLELRITAEGSLDDEGTSPFPFRPLSRS
jgi:hypothetical protein